MLRDLVVVLPGIMGSTLAKDDKMVWAPSAGAVLRAITTFGRSLKSLELPEGIGDNHPNDGVVPTALMPDLNVLPGLWTMNIGYDALLDWLRSKCPPIDSVPNDAGRHPNMLPVPYDWRLSNRYNGRRLKSIVEPALEQWRSLSPELADAKIIFVCHSMGGLVARWYIDREGGAEVTRKLVTLGTPHRGALEALEQLVNGVHKGVGPMALDLTRFARSLPSLHQLLPQYACIESPTGLLTTSETDISDLDREMALDAAHFHNQLDSARSEEYDFHPIVGFRQPTKTTARIGDGHVSALYTIEGDDDGGDGTVPRLSAIPAKFRPDDPSIRSAADRHGSLQNNKSVLDEIEFVLSARREPYKAPQSNVLSVEMDELVFAGEKLSMTVTNSEDSRAKLQAIVRNEAGQTAATAFLQSGTRTTLADPLPPGGYVVTVGGVGTATTRIGPVACPILVWDGEVGA